MNGEPTGVLGATAQPLGLTEIPSLFQTSGLWSPSLGWVDQGALVVHNGVIQDCGNGAEVRQRWPSLSPIDATQYTLTPGLINSHTHSAMNFLRGLTLGVQGMIENVFFNTESALTPPVMERLAFGFLAESLLSGVTCVVEHYYFSEEIAQMVDRLGMRAWIGEAISDRKGPFHGGTASARSWAEARAFLDQWPFSNRIRPVVCPHAMDTVSPGLLTDMAAYARVHQLPLHMHLSQSLNEKTFVQSEFGCTPVDMARRCRALGPMTLAVHLLSADRKDLAVLRDEGATVVLCPTSEILYEKAPEMNMIKESGVAFALGTDCAASNDSADLLAEGKLTALLSRLQGAPLDTLDIWKAMTTVPAQGLGQAGKLGDFYQGSPADLVFWQHSVRNQPMFRPDVNLIYSFSSKDVSHVMVDGVWRVWNGQLTCVDSKSLFENYKTACQEIYKKIHKEEKMEVPTGFEPA